jgi:exopolysaccharide biosynthesis WecB/TagA/CpsF family protein
MDWTGVRVSGADGRPVAGISVNVISRETLLADLKDRFERRLGFSVATLNLDHVVKLRSPGAFRDAYAAHTHVTADGNPIVWLSRLAGRNLALVPGSDLIEPLSQLAAEMKVQVALLGTTEESLEGAQEALLDRYPDLQIVTRISPAMGFDPTGPVADAAISQLQATGARLVFLALGAPKQEIFAARAQDQLPQTGFLSIGAGLDFISGTQFRASKIVRRFALEWLWRLMLNPAGLARRYGACLAILPGLVVSAYRYRLEASRD